MPQAETAAYPTDEQILEIDDSPSSEVSSESAETSESTAPIETQPEEATAETQLSPDQAKDETLTQSQQADKAQPAKTQPAKDAQEQAQALQLVEAKAAELDRIDAALLSGDTATMAETFASIFDGNPAGCAEALWVGSRYLEQYAPEHYSNYQRMIVADELGNLGTWGDLERAHELALRAGNRELATQIDQLAGKLQGRYGLGPATEEQLAAQLDGFRKHAVSHLEKTADREIVRAFGSQFDLLKPADKKEVMTAARDILQKQMRVGQQIKTEFAKLVQKYSPKEGTRVLVEVLGPMIRTAARYAATSITSAYGSLFKPAPPQATPKPAPQPLKPAPKMPTSWAEVHSQRKTFADVLKQMKEQEGLMDEPALTQDEANGLSDRDILDSSRPSQQRKPWRPEDIFA